MSQDLTSKIEEATRKSKNWHIDGWATTFGPRKTHVDNLESAENLPGTFVYKEEAIGYWKRVRNAAHDAGEYGDKALDAIKKGDMKSAEDYVYAALLTEKPIRERSDTWGEVYNEISAANGSKVA